MAALQARINLTRLLDDSDVYAEVQERTSAVWGKTTFHLSIKLLNTSVSILNELGRVLAYIYAVVYRLSRYGDPQSTSKSLPSVTTALNTFST